MSDFQRNQSESNAEWHKCQNPNATNDQVNKVDSATNQRCTCYCFLRSVWAFGVLMWEGTVTNLVFQKKTINKTLQNKHNDLTYFSTPGVLAYVFVVSVGAQCLRTEKLLTQE